MLEIRAHLAMATEHSTNRNRRLALMPTLMLSMGVLVLLSVGSVMAVNWVAERRIVQELSSRLIARGLAAEERTLRNYLDAAVQQGEFVASAIRSGRYSLTDPALADFAGGTLAAAPQVQGLIIIDASGHALRAARVPSGTEFRIDHFDVSMDAQLAKLAGEVRARKQSFWGQPIYRETAQQTFLYYCVPIWKDDDYRGFVTLGISTRALSELARALSEPSRLTAFILYRQDRVLAHPRMVQGNVRQSASASFPLLRTFGDPVIDNLDSLPPIHEVGLKAPTGVLAREKSVEGEGYFIFAREIADYNELPITIGAYVLKRAVDAPVVLLYWATAYAIGLMAVSLVAAALLAGAIARPIRRAARGATAIGNLNFDKVTPLQGGFFRETHSLAISFNAMLEGLKAFGRYVPNTLVARLIKEERVGAGTEERVLAVMFTDIVSFTSTCEAMTASEVAAFINQHLSLVSACVEHEGGTIDKFIGDAVMAFWGAPGRIDNPAAAACRAAVGIQQALAADNQRRVGAGAPPVRIRIGVHMGAVVVGDIGAPNRINYTIVGDVVNATQRLESLGKSVDADAEAIVLVSGEIFATAGSGFRFVKRGAHLVKGKQESIEVYQLIGKAG